MQSVETTQKEIGLEKFAITKEYCEVLQTMIDSIPGFGVMAICPAPSLDEIIQNAISFMKKGNNK